MKVMLALALLALVVFCCFGLLATYEPVEQALEWRVGYGVALVVCLHGLWRLLLPGEAD